MSRRPEGRPMRGGRSALAVVVLSGVLAVSACTGPADPVPRPSSSGESSAAPSASPTGTETTDPTAPTLVPDGSAEDNLPLFTAVISGVWASPDSVAGRGYIDALVAAGFDKTAMQLTADRTTVGNPAESIQFSVRWGDQCLVGQVGPATGSPVSVIVPVLSEGTCLVGQTRPIDW